MNLKTPLVEKDSFRPEYLGFLTKEMLENSVAFLGEIANGTSMAFLEVDLSGMGLTNIVVLSKYVHLQVIDLSYNQLTDLHALDELPHLLYLNVTKNRLTKLLDFEPPFALREAFYTSNFVQEIPDLSSHWALKKLNLDYNRIVTIEGLSQCKSLTHLSLSGNYIKNIQGLNFLPLKVLVLSHNSITEIKNLETLFYLEELDLGYNQLKSIRGLQGHYYLRALSLIKNNIRELSEISLLRRLPALQAIDLRHNLICHERDYMNIALFFKPRISLLDGRPVKTKDKVAALNMYKPSQEVKANKDHLVNKIFNFMQPLKVRPSTAEYGAVPLNMLVLVGPLGSAKSQLVERLCSEFPNDWGMALSHTTRAQRRFESSDKDYAFISIRTFDAMLQTGEFLETAVINGEHYGLSYNALDRVAAQGLSCITYMELEGVMSLKNSHLKPKVILVMPFNELIHRSRLETLYEMNSLLVLETLQRRTLYSNFHQNIPGFFSLLLNTDNIEAAYRELLIFARESHMHRNRGQDECYRTATHWKPAMAVNIFNKLEINSLEYRQARARLAFRGNRDAGLCPASASLRPSLHQETSS